jgi:hypothetical protein
VKGLILSRDERHVGRGNPTDTTMESWLGGTTTASLTSVVQATVVLHQLNVALIQRYELDHPSGDQSGFTGL